MSISHVRRKEKHKGSVISAVPPYECAAPQMRPPGRAHREGVIKKKMLIEMEWLMRTETRRRRDLFVLQYLCRGIVTKQQKS